MQDRRRVIMVGGELDYYDYKVEYIENTTGNEIIDTGFKPTNKTTMICEAVMLNYTYSDISTGDRLSTAGNGWQEFGYGFTYNKNQNKIYSFLGTSYNDFTINLSYGVKYKFELRSSNNGTVLAFLVNDSQKVSRSWTKGNASAPVSISVFGGHSTVGYGSCHAMRLYGYKLYDNGTLVRDFIPVVKDGVAGMWDNVHSKFYGNAKNETTFFAAGPAYVDLGLPSGLLWARHNVRATTESESGDFFYYGSGANSVFEQDTHYEGSENPLPLSKDTARQVMGGEWRMPTYSECEELISNTTIVKATIDGVSGIKVISNNNSNYIFLPYAGVVEILPDISYVGERMRLFTSTPQSNMCYGLCSDSSTGTLYTSRYLGRYTGCPVRGVHAAM